MNNQGVAVNLWLSDEQELKRDAHLSAVPRVGDKVAFTSGGRAFNGTVQEVIFHEDGNARVKLGKPMDEV